MEIERNKIKTGLDCFEIDCGRFPSTAENLSALVTRPTDVPEMRWHGPYLPSVPKDQWGHDYVYCCPGIHNTSPFYDLYSCGPDGVSKSGGDDPDDIPNW
jgi:general secretion pathway protein G